jgi:hypothetical protein
MAANFAPVESEANTGKVRVGLVLGREHRIKGLGLEDRAMLVGATPEQRYDIASDVPRGRVDATAGDGDEVVVADQAWAMGTQCVPRREATADAIGSDQIGLLHAEQLEDVFAEVALQGLPGHVLDDLAERGEPVIAVDVPHAGFCDQAQTVPVVLGEGGHRPSGLHHLSKGRLERSREMDALREPGGIGQ